MEPEKLNINPKNHILNKQVLQQFQCLICTQKSLNMLRCKTCKKCLCFQCSIDQKTKQDKCPQRCTNTELKLQLIPSFCIEFKCPFSDLCKIVIKSKKQFHQHDRFCQHMNQYQKQQMVKKWRFLCRRGHNLEIRIQTYSNLIQRKPCSICNQFGIVRVACRKCDEVFCNYCRPFPIFEMKCPIGHKLLQRDVQTLSYRCDICEISPYILGGCIYDDFICNLGICNLCLKDYPQFVQSVQYIQNLNNYCDVASDVLVKKKMTEIQLKELESRHKLIILPKQEIQKCSWCQKKKPCYKLCKECNKYFCINCKRIQIFQNMQCQFGHKVEKIQEIQIQNQSQQNKSKNQNKCYLCHSEGTAQNTISSGYYIDSVCNVIFCAKHLNDVLRYNFDVSFKDISFTVRPCYKSESHPLFYLPYRQDFYDYCQNCSEYKNIKFNCSMCNIPKNYCCKCIPAPDLKKCYCGLQLQAGAKCEGKCLLCDKKSQVYKCNKCRYLICEDCMKGTQPQKVQQMEST